MDIRKFLIKVMVKQENHRKWLISSIFVFLLTLSSCGGGSSGNGNGSMGGGSSSASCGRMSSEEQALAELDLSDPERKQIHDTLLSVDSSHGYQVFIRHPDDFMLFYELEETSGGHDIFVFSSPVHETNHEISRLLAYCSPNSKSKYLLFDEIYTTELTDPSYASFNTDFDKGGVTAHISIVEETIDSSLKTHGRYTAYIEGTKEYGNNFSTLLDEFTAYLGQAWFQEKYINAVPKPSGSALTKINSGTDGTVNFMVFLQYYLKSARLNHPGSYAIIQQEATLALIQTLWSKAEEMLETVYPLTLSGNTSSYGVQVGISLDYLRAAYSEDLLSELDRINIVHRPASAWDDTYFQSSGE